MSLTRPDVTAGPIDRSSRPFQVSDERSGGFLSSAGAAGAAAFLPGGSAAVPRAAARVIDARPSAMRRCIFMGADYSNGRMAPRGG